LKLHTDVREGRGGAVKLKECRASVRDKRIERESDDG